MHSRKSNTLKRHNESPVTGFYYFCFYNLFHASIVYRIRLPDLNYPGAGNGGQQASPGIPHRACTRWTVAKFYFRIFACHDRLQCSFLYFPSATAVRSCLANFLEGVLEVETRNHEFCFPHCHHHLLRDCVYIQRIYTRLYIGARLFVGRHYIATRCNFGDHHHAKRKCTEVIGKHYRRRKPAQ